MLFNSVEMQLPKRYRPYPCLQNAIAMLNNAGVLKDGLPNTTVMTDVECRLCYCCRSSYHCIVALVVALLVLSLDLELKDQAFSNL